MKQSAAQASDGNVRDAVRHGALYLGCLQARGPRRGRLTHAPAACGNSALSGQTTLDAPARLSSSAIGNRVQRRVYLRRLEIPLRWPFIPRAAAVASCIRSVDSGLTTGMLLWGGGGNLDHSTRACGRTLSTSSTPGPKAKHRRAITVHSAIGPRAASRAKASAVGIDVAL
jgi:hypothetical protein